MSIFDITTHSPSDNELRARKPMQRNDAEIITIRLTTNQLYDIRTAIMADAVREKLDYEYAKNSGHDADLPSEYVENLEELSRRLPFVDDVDVSI